jgi:hypothetical protein
VRLEGAVTAATRARAVAVMHSLDFVGIVERGSHSSHGIRCPVPSALRPHGTVCTAGLVERFDDSMLLLRYVFRTSWPHLTSFTVENTNVAKIKLPFTPEEHAFLKRANQHDTALHAAASARLDAEWTAMLADESFSERGMRFYSPDRTKYTLTPASDVPPPAPPAEKQQTDPWADRTYDPEFCQVWATERSKTCG